MGQDSSSSSKGESSRGRVPSATPARDHRPAYAPTPAPIADQVEIAGASPAEKRCLITTPQLISHLAHKLPVSCSSVKWYLLFNSNIHGKSFNKFVSYLCESGPTLIVISTTDGDIFGGFNESEWLTVSARDKQAVSQSAAARRAAREGQSGNTGPSRPANQNNLFFGDSNCFVFTWSASGGSATVSHANGSLNSNFMYLFDTHPDSEKIGIGMGGQPGYFGWFLDRWLENGQCAGESCTTFRSQRLTRSERWRVDTVEAYAVHPDFVQRLIESGRRETGKSVLDDNDETNVNKFMMQAHGIHEFDKNERTEC